MKKISDSNTPAGLSDSANVNDVALAAQENPQQHQWATILWILVAWVVGTFVIEMGAVGQEPETLKTSEASDFEALGRYTGLWQELSSQETEKAITLSGISALDRVNRNDAVRPMLDAMIVAEETKLAVRAPLRSSPVRPTGNHTAADSRHDKLEVVADAEASVDQAVRITDGAEQANDSETRLAVGEQPETALTGIIKMVVHSVSELMKPVHVSPRATDAQLVDPSPEDRASVAYVEADAQQRDMQPAGTEEIVTSETDAEDVLPSESQSIVEESSILEEPMTAVAQIGAERENPAAAVPPVANIDASTVAGATTIPGESQPQPEKLNSPSKHLAPLTQDPYARIVRGQPYLLAVPHASMPERAEEDEVAGPAEARVAAKWPFELAKQPTGPGVSLNVDQTDVRTVLEMLARGYGMNILVAPEVQGLITANVQGLTPDQTLNGILRMCDLRAQREEDLIYVYASDRLPANARQLQMFTLDYARAENLEATIQGLLSPVGNAYITAMDSQDNLKTQEAIVVIDIPEVIVQVEQYVLQADQPPRQVMIEAHVLEVELTDDIVNGVDFNAILGGDLTIGAVGFADRFPTPANPVYFASVTGEDVQALLTVLETTTDAKTLASPRVMVVNGQNARIQVGQQLGFTVATVTQTSTIQDVQFLDTGVVLTVTPTISRDNRILLQVKPQVSTGQINPKTLLPEQETREAETSVLLNDHQGVVIGGLIQETDLTVIKKLPWLGDFRYVGKLFQRREATRSRSEVVIALVPHIVEGDCVYDERDAIDLDRAVTPLFEGPLRRTCRPWEAYMPDPVGLEHHLRDYKRGYRALPPVLDH